MEQKGTCIKAQLVASKQEGPYRIYVFENVDLPLGNNEKFISCTRCPNWNGEEPTEFQEGFMTYKFVRGGVDTYYHSEDQKLRCYLSDQIYFQDFVPITHVLNDGRVVKKGIIKVS